MAALDDMIAAAGKAAKIERVAGTVIAAEAKAARVAETAHAQRIALNEAGLQKNLLRQEKTRIQKAEGSPSTLTEDLKVEEQIRFEAGVEADAVRRTKALTDPNAKLDFSVQSNTPEEYASRMVQLRSSKYAANIVSGDDANDAMRVSMAKDIDHGLAIDESFQQIVKKHRGGPRAEQAIRDAVGDTPYKSLDGTPQVMVHIDTFTDPIRGGSGEFIQQLDEAYEIGLHSGTNLAAIKATLIDPDALAFRLADRDAEIGELDSLANMDGQLVKTFVVALRDHLYQRFARGEDVLRDKDLFLDFKVTFTTALERMGIVGDDAGIERIKMMTRMKQIPLPNSTAHYFNGPNGLLMEDLGGWKPNVVLRQLTRDIFPEFAEALNAEYSAALGQAAKTRVLRQFINDRGYDHIAYHNTVEDIGSLSIIHWNPENMIPILDVRVTGGTAQGKTTAAVAFIMGAMFSESALQGKE